MKIRDEVLYLGDNGRCYCGEHLGMTAKHTGRDISGQEIMPITPDAVEEADRMGVTLTCEDARCDRTPSRLHLP